MGNLNCVVCNKMEDLTSIKGVAIVRNPPQELNI